MTTGEPRAGLSLGLVWLLLMACASVESPSAETRSEAPEAKAVPEPTVQHMDGYTRITVCRPIQAVFPALRRLYPGDGPVSEGAAESPTDWRIVEVIPIGPSSGRGFIEARELSKLLSRTTSLVVQSKNKATAIDVAVVQRSRSSGRETGLLAEIIEDGFTAGTREAHGATVEVIRAFLASPGTWE